MSTTLQDPALQVNALEAAGCYAIYTDHASGAKADRPELMKVMETLRLGEPWWCGGWTALVVRCGT